MRRSTVCRLCALVCVLALLLSGCKVVKKLTGRMNTESENENLPRNRTDPEAFRTLENGAVDYPGACLLLLRPPGRERAHTPR